MIKSMLLTELLDVVAGRIVDCRSEHGCAENSVSQDALTITGVSTDTRTLSAGDLYVPLKGERFNGHDFMSQAHQAGAIAALIDEDCAAVDDMVLIRVDDCLLALGQLAQYQRRQFGGPVVAVTGSAGKTSVKQLMANVLSQQYNTWMTQGNLNNHIGAPLTLLSIQPEHEAAMIELGASGLKEIGYTAQFVEPQVGIITNASAAHLDGFGSLEGIVKTKGELLDFIQTGGCAVLNRDDVYFSDWYERAKKRDLKVLCFGLHADADIRAENIESTLDGCRFQLLLEGQQYAVNFPLLGEHNVRNALAVVAAARALTLPMEYVIRGLETAQAFQGRLRWCDGAQGQRMLDDSYNASPASVRAAIQVLANAEHSWLVLGDMAELGDVAEQTHQEIGLYAKQQGIKHLVATGRLNKNTVAAFGDNGIWFENRRELVHYLQQQTQAGDVLLIKGSRSAGMDQVVTAMQSAVPSGEEDN